MSTKKYEKHMSSKYKKFVATLTNGKRLEADTQAELTKLINASVVKQVEDKTRVLVKPQYDPDTGELIN